MSAIISATEWNIRQAFDEYAEAEGWDVPLWLLGRMAKVAAEARHKPRPQDPAPGTTTAGRKVGRRAAGRPSAGRGAGSGSSGTRAASGALQSPSVAPMASEGPVRASGRPSEARNSPEGSFSRTGVPQAATEPHRASGGAR